MVFEIFVDSDDCYRWHLRNRQGRIIALAAEGFGDLDQAMRNLADVRDSVRAEIRTGQE